MNMNQLTYLVNWGKNKETAWSGTNYSLYKALQKYYDIHDVNLSGNRWVNAFMRRILRMDWMQIGYYRTKMIRHQLRNVRDNVFQFGEYLNDTDSRKTYMYVDCTLGYVDYLRTHLPDIFAVSAYQDIDPTVIDKRTRAQGDYIKNHSSGLFTMGHWLREWLIEQGVDASLVHAVGGYNVDTQLISPQPKTHNKILFVGKDFKRKGGYITYDAFKLLREQGENVELYVIGPQENPIEDPVAGYHFIGQIPFNEDSSRPLPSASHASAAPVTRCRTSSMRATPVSFSVTMILTTMPPSCRPSSATLPISAASLPSAPTTSKNTLGMPWQNEWRG